MTKNTNKSSRLDCKFSINSQICTVFLVMTLLVIAGCTQNVRLESSDLSALNQRYQQMKNSEIADSAPVEMRFIGEKIESAYAAFNANDNKTVTYLVEQIELDFKIAETRSLVNKLNDDLLDSREKISEAQLLLEDLKEQLQ